MAWDQLWINKPHVAYAVIGGFTTVFSLISLFVKEKLYIGEATVAGIFGIIVGPHCLDWFSPTTWGNTDNITLELSRIVLVVQIFAVAVELPKKYMLRHWFSVSMLLLPVMIFGWLLSSVFIWKLVPSLRWIEALVLAACITATDPVLASAVVGKGKFAQRVPGHLRNLLSAESGCNDGMAFPFAYLALLCILHEGHPREIAFHWFVVAVIYECVFGVILGAIIGYLGRHLIKFAEQKKLIDRESFLVFYFVLALFCTGVGSIIGVDDLLVAFAAGCAFSWDGWFSKKTEESHVSDVIDLLLNMAFFVYFGAIVPWDQFNNTDIGISVWKLVIIAILVILFRRIPIILALKPVIPDIKTWREALFCGHFGPIGVGAIFMAILSRAELEHGDPTPLAELPGKEHPNYYAVATIWPVVTFLIVASIIVHGSSIAVFTLGKRLNNLTITMTATTKGSTNQTWLSRIGTESSRTFSLRRIDTNKPDFPTIAASTNPEKPGLGRRRKHRKSHKQRRRNGEEPTPPAAIALDLGGQGRSTIVNGSELDSTSVSTKNNFQAQSFEGGEPEEHISIIATSEDGSEAEVKMKPSQMRPKLREKLGVPAPGEPPHPTGQVSGEINAYKLGDMLVLEDYDGEVLQTIHSSSSAKGGPELEIGNVKDGLKKSGSMDANDGGLPLPALIPLAQPAKAVTKHSSPPPPTQRPRKNSLPPVRGSGHHHATSPGTSSVGGAGQTSASASSGAYIAANPHHPSRKITAYQLDDNIIVENEDGDIIKRYHITHKSHDQAGSHDQHNNNTNTPYSHSAGGILSSSLDRTLSHLGLRKRGNTMPPSTQAGGDLEKQGGHGPEVSTAIQASKRPINEEAMRRHLKNLLVRDARESRAGAGGRIFIGSEDEEGSESGSESSGSSVDYSSDEKEGATGATTSASGSSRRNQLGSTTSPPRLNAMGRPVNSRPVASRLDDDEEETEVERQRRLAALGIIDNEDDERDVNEKGKM